MNAIIDGPAVRHDIAELLRCIAYRLDTQPTDLAAARTRYRAAMRRHVAAEVEAAAHRV
jgi:hypothetical protein